MPAPAPLALGDAPRRALAPTMRIPGSAALGRGRTTLSAFDAALRAAGVANFNLVRLSSVIPTGAVVEPVPAPAAAVGGWGDRLYVVMAEQRVAQEGREAWAGIGWVQQPDSGAGLFVEHEADSEEEVRQLIRISLEDMTAGRPGSFDDPGMHIIGGRCDGSPLCALVVAVFEAAAWTRTEGRR
jgi:arginine decarboxylase